MTISEVITNLENLQEQYGPNIEVAVEIFNGKSIKYTDVQVTGYSKNIHGEKSFHKAMPELKKSKEFAFLGISI